MVLILFVDKAENVDQKYYMIESEIIFNVVVPS